MSGIYTMGEDSSVAGQAKNTSLGDPGPSQRKNSVLDSLAGVYSLGGWKLKRETPGKQGQPQFLVVRFFGPWLTRHTTTN
jgi:hypothetical protein